MKKGCSCMLLASDVDGAEIKKVGVRIVAVDFEDFGDESPARSAFDVNDDVEGVGDVRLDRAVWQFHAALQDATRESCQSLFCRTRVNCAQRAGVARVEELKQVECLTSSNFSQQNTVRAMSQRG